MANAQDKESQKLGTGEKKWSQKLGGSNTMIQKLRTHDLELIDEARRLQIENANKDISLAKSKAENDIKSKKIRSLESMIKILESKLSSAQKDVISIQNDSSKKETEIISLKSKIVEVEHELASKVSELENLKLETISIPVVGGNDEKNMTKSNDISAVIEESEIRGYASPSKNLRQYFVRRKSIDQAKKIDDDISTQTSTFGTCFVNDEITELPKIDTEVNSEVKDRTSISEINKDDIPIKSNTSEAMPQNVTPHLTQPDNNSKVSAKAHMSSLIKSNSQMRPGPEALPLPIGGIGTIPIVTSTLMLPLSAYMLLTLLIIAVMWFVILRCT
ncbi:845_t:CDS:2 [Funneliformis mosseae]|uniref:845_t:CDS:1 n=1 Tax=Funneliformis mosseae TaxID=27381 RepID=A0A9N8WUJ6_FUNMO|nr:845_t:CDS:2 [Funneliformis mosseae]